MSNNTQNVEEPHAQSGAELAEHAAVRGLHASPEESREQPHAQSHGSEEEERQAAARRGRLARQQMWARAPLPPLPHDPQLTNPAIAALCENVRDYAIFMMDPHGVIVYLGMGAHLMKWWTKEEAEGGHLRLLYPESGSEDGTAEDHLRQAAEEGEYVGEGQRIRRGGTTFWAHVTLTALRDAQGTLLGFAKVTQDLTRRRALESAESLAHEARVSRDSAITTAQEAQASQSRAELIRERAEEAAQFALEQARASQSYINNVLVPELAAERAERAALEAEVKAHEEQRRYNERQS